jgi:DNA-binding CsgD family transcriptional regulator
MLLEKFSIQEISRQIRTNEKTLHEINEYLPCHSHINSTEDFSILETDCKMTDYFDMSMECINNAGFEFLQRIVNKGDLNNAINANMYYLQNLETETHVSFFQRIKFNQISEEQNFYTRGRILDAKRIFNLSIPIHNIHLFHHKMSDICEHTDFVRANTGRYNQLTKRELTIAEKLAKGDTMQKVSEELTISIHTLKNHKTNIYKKMNVKNYFEFYNFASKFKLIGLNEY